MKKGKKADSISTFLGPDARIEGTLAFKNTIIIDGTVKGKIFSNGGTVVIAEQAVINADISVGVARIKGEVNGTVEAKERIEIYPPARVVGDIRAPAILIEAGVVFNGKCTMQAGTISSEEVLHLSEKHGVTGSSRGE